MWTEEDFFVTVRRSDSSRRCPARNSDVEGAIVKLVITVGLAGTSKAGKFDAFLTAEEDIHAAFIDFMGYLPASEIEQRIYEVIDLPDTHAGRALAGIVSLEDELGYTGKTIRGLFLKVFESGKNSK